MDREGGVVYTHVPLYSATLEKPRRLERTTDVATNRSDYINNQKFLKLACPPAVVEWSNRHEVNAKRRFDDKMLERKKKKSYACVLFWLVLRVLNGIAEVHVALENTCRAHWTCEKYIYCTVYVYFQFEEVCNEMCCSFFFSFFGLKPAVVLPLQLRASHLCISSFYFFQSGEEVCSIVFLIVGRSISSPGERQIWCGTENMAAHCGNSWASNWRNEWLNLPRSTIHFFDWTIESRRFNGSIH